MTLQGMGCVCAVVLVSSCLHVTATPLSVSSRVRVANINHGQVTDVGPTNYFLRSHALDKRSTTEEGDLAARESRGLLTSLFGPLFGGGGHRERSGSRGNPGGREGPFPPRRPVRPAHPPPPPDANPQHIFIPITSHNIVKFPVLPEGQNHEVNIPETKGPETKTVEESKPVFFLNQPNPTEFSKPRPEDVINIDQNEGLVSLSPLSHQRQTPPISLEPPPYPFESLRPPEGPPPSLTRFTNFQGTGLNSEIRFPLSSLQSPPDISSSADSSQGENLNRESVNIGQVLLSNPATRFPQDISVSQEAPKGPQGNPNAFLSFSNANEDSVPTGGQFSQPLLPDDSSALIPFRFGDDFFITGNPLGGTSETGNVNKNNGNLSSVTPRSPDLLEIASPTAFPPPPPTKRTQIWPSPPINQGVSTQVPPVQNHVRLNLSPPKPWTVLPSSINSESKPRTTPSEVRQHGHVFGDFDTPPPVRPTTESQEQSFTTASPLRPEAGTTTPRLETISKQASHVPRGTENPWTKDWQQNAQSIEGNLVEDTHVKKRENNVSPTVTSFAPLPGFSTEELGPPGSTVQGFFPYENSDEFFQQVFRNADGFGVKIVTEPTSKFSATPQTMQESQLPTSRAGLSASGHVSTPSSHRFPSMTSPSLTETLKVSLKPSVLPPAVGFSHSSLNSISNQRVLPRDVVPQSDSIPQPSTSDPFNAFLANHQLTPSVEDKFVPVRTLTAGPEPSFNDFPPFPPAQQPPPSEVHSNRGPNIDFQGASNLLPGSVQFNPVPSQITTPFTSQQSRFEDNSMKARDPLGSPSALTPTPLPLEFDPFPPPDTLLADDHQAPGEDNSPSTSTTTTTIVSLPNDSQEKVEVLVLPYKDVEDGSLRDTSRRNLPERPSAINFGLPLKAAEEEVSVYLVRQERPERPRGFPSPTPPTPPTPPTTVNSRRTRPRVNGEILHSNEESSALGKAALEFPGFPVPLELVATEGELDSGAESSSLAPIFDFSRIEIEKDEGFQLQRRGDAPSETQERLPSHFEGSLDPAGFDPARDFESDTSIDSTFEFVGPATVVSSIRDEEGRDSKALALPQTLACQHGFCDNQSLQPDNSWGDLLPLNASEKDVAVFTYSELHSPANDSYFYDQQQPEDRYVCNADVREVRPAWGRSDDGSLLKIINTKAFPQKIRMEVCRHAGQPCSFLAKVVKSSCRQRYSIHKMAAIDPRDPDGGVFLAAFKVPSGCFCHVRQSSSLLNGPVANAPKASPLVLELSDALQAQDPTLAPDEDQSRQSEEVTFMTPESFSGLFTQGGQSTDSPINNSATLVSTQTNQRNQFSFSGPTEDNFTLEFPRSLDSTVLNPSASNINNQETTGSNPDGSLQSNQVISTFEEDFTPINSNTFLTSFEPTQSQVLSFSSTQQTASAPQTSEDVSVPETFVTAPFELQSTQNQSSDENYILSLRRVMGDGSEHPLEVIISVDGRLIGPMNQLSQSPSPTTLQGLSGTPNEGLNMGLLLNEIDQQRDVFRTKRQMADSSFTILQSTERSGRDKADATTIVNPLVPTEISYDKTPTNNVTQVDRSFGLPIKNSKDFKYDSESKDRTNEPLSDFQYITVSYGKNDSFPLPSEKALMNLPSNPKVSISLPSAGYQATPDSNRSQISLPKSLSVNLTRHKAFSLNPSNSNHNGSLNPENINLRVPEILKIITTTERQSKDINGDPQERNDGHRPFLSTHLYASRPHVIQNYYIDIPDDTQRESGEIVEGSQSLELQSVYKKSKESFSKSLRASETKVNSQFAADKDPLNVSHNANGSDSFKSSLLLDRLSSIIASSTQIPLLSTSPSSLPSDDNETNVNGAPSVAVSGGGVFDARPRVTRDVYSTPDKGFIDKDSTSRLRQAINSTTLEESSFQGVNNEKTNSTSVLPRSSLLQIPRRRKLRRKQSRRRSNSVANIRPQRIRNTGDGIKKPNEESPSGSRVKTPKGSLEGSIRTKVLRTVSPSSLAAMLLSQNQVKKPRTTINKTTDMNFRRYARERVSKGSNKGLEDLYLSDTARLSNQGRSNLGNQNMKSLNTRTKSISLSPMTPATPLPMVVARNGVFSVQKDRQTTSSPTLNRSDNVGNLKARQNGKELGIDATNVDASAVANANSKSFHRGSLIPPNWPPAIPTSNPREEYLELMFSSQRIPVGEVP